MIDRVRLLKFWRLGATPILCTVGGLLLSGCSLTGRMSTFDPKGPIAQNQLNLFYITLVVTGFLWLSVGSVLLFALVKFREKPGDADKPFPSQGHGNPFVEISLIGASILCLVIIAVPTVRGIWMMEVLPVPEEEAIVVNVTGYQWWWKFEYPDEGIVTANELTIPVGKVVKLNLRSEDVIHSFWIPKLAGKVDLMPGRKNWMWLQADEEGYYFGQCAEYCGESHAYMLIRADALSESDWDDWVQQQQVGASPPENAWMWETVKSGEESERAQYRDDPVFRGAELFSGRGGCVQCHTVDGKSMDSEIGTISISAGTDGPNLTHVASRSSLAAGMLENRGDDGKIDAEKQLDNLFRWIYTSETVKPGNLMASTVQEKIASNGLTKGDFQDIAAFLQSLK